MLDAGSQLSVQDCGYGRGPARAVRRGVQMQWQVGDVMTREVITVGADTPAGRIASLLDREGISAVPVTAATGGVLGVVSQADLLTDVPDGEPKPMRSDRAASGATAVSAGDLMTAPALFIDADASLAQAAKAM